MFTHAAYDPDTFTLTVRYHPTKSNAAGATFQHLNISEELADDFFKAASLGKFFLQHIKGNPDHPSHKIHESELTPAAALLDQLKGSLAAANPERAVVNLQAVKKAVDRAQEQAREIAENDGRTFVNTAVPEVSADQDEMKLQALEVATQVKALIIQTADDYAIAGNELVRLRTMRKQAQERVNRIKHPAYETYKAALQLEHDVMEPYHQAEQFLDGGMATYRQHERQQRLLAEQEENRRRLEAAEAEARRKAEEARAEDLKTAKAQGNLVQVAELLQQPLELTPMPVQRAVLPTAVPAVKGIIQRPPEWHWRVKQGAEHLIPREYLVLNEKAIGAAVRTQKGLTKIAGIEVWSEEAKVGVKA
jgi:hypothetical protein